MYINNFYVEIDKKKYEFVFIDENGNIFLKGFFQRYNHFGGGDKVDIFIEDKHIGNDYFYDYEELRVSIMMFIKAFYINKKNEVFCQAVKHLKKHKVELIYKFKKI